MPTIEPGTLYLVATPIGNLGDISQRALAVLGGADVVASEDTRKTGLLLHHFGLKKPQISFYEHNEARAGRAPHGRCWPQGQSVALVTDAGTPGIADPGFTLVRRAIAAGTPVTAVPGPVAFVPALILSGLAVHSFTFRGFPPRKPGARRRFLAVDRDAPHTLIFYESPYRLLDLLADAQAVFGDRPAAVANDLTKLFERVDRGPLSALIALLQSQKLRGEYVVVIAGAGAEGAPAPPPDAADADADADEDAPDEDAPDEADAPDEDAP